MVARAAGEAVDLVDAVLLSHENCITHSLIEFCSQFLVRMNRVAMAGECADFEIVLLEKAEPFLILFFVVQENVRIAVILARIATGTDFYHLQALGMEVSKSFLKRLITEEVRAYA